MTSQNHDLIKKSEGRTCEFMYVEKRNSSVTQQTKKKKKKKKNSLWVSSNRLPGDMCQQGQTGDKCHTFLQASCRRNVREAVGGVVNICWYRGGEAPTQTCGSHMPPQSPNTDTHTHTHAPLGPRGGSS